MERRLITFDTGNIGYHTATPYAHENILTGGAQGRMLEVANIIKKEQLGTVTGTYKNEDRGLSVVHLFYKDTPITAFSTGMGTSSVSPTWPEIIEACPHNDINAVRIGTSGGRKDYLKVGDLVIGTEIHYKDNTTPIALSLLPAIHNYLKNPEQLAQANEKLQKVVKRVQEVHPSIEIFERAMYKVLPQGDPKQYQPHTNARMQSALMVATARHILPNQVVHSGPTSVTPEIYVNSLLGDPGVPENTRAVSMEASALQAYGDLYGVIDGRKIQFGNLLMISDLLVGEADNMQDFLDKKAEFERAHILAGLDALVIARQNP